MEDNYYDNFKRVKTLNEKLAFYYDCLKPFETDLSKVAAGKIILDEDELSERLFKAIKLALCAAVLEVKKQKRLERLPKAERKKLYKDAVMMIKG